jgi:chromosome segregation ATPase
MSNEEFEKRIKEHLDQLTAIVLNIDERVDRIGKQVEKLTENVNKLTDVVLGLTSIVGRHDRQIAENDKQIAELVEQGKATDERLNALIAIVEKTFRRPDAE